MDLHLKDCPHCLGNDYNCKWCDGLGKLIIDIKALEYEIEVENAKLTWYREHPKEHFKSKINYFIDYDENDEVKIDSNHRIQHEILDDILDSCKAIDKLVKTHRNLDTDYIEYLVKKGFRYEQTAHTLCELCTKRGCDSCNNNPQNIFYDDTAQYFEPINTVIKEWYESIGYKLETY
jgi:hypothetical protein